MKYIFFSYLIENFDYIAHGYNCYILSENVTDTFGAVARH